MANNSDDEKQIQKAEFRTEKKQRKTAPRRDSGRRIFVPVAIPQWVTDRAIPAVQVLSLC